MHTAGHSIPHSMPSWTSIQWLMHSCWSHSATCSLIQFSVSVVSYEKHLQSSGGTIPYPSQVRNPSSQQFISENQDKFLLRVPGFSTFKISQAGFSGVKDGDEVCQGVSTMRNDELKEKLVEYSIFAVTITLGKFVNDSHFNPRK